MLWANRSGLRFPKNQSKSGSIMRPCIASPVLTVTVYIISCFKASTYKYPIQCIPYWLVTFFTKFWVRAIALDIKLIMPIGLNHMTMLTRKTIILLQSEPFLSKMLVLGHWAAYRTPVKNCETIIASEWPICCTRRRPNPKKIENEINPKHIATVLY